jgi:hypothetical protein
MEHKIITTEANSPQIYFTGQNIPCEGSIGQYKASSRVRYVGLARTVYVYIIYTLYVTVYLMKSLPKNYKYVCIHGSGQP